ncbi:response regulator [Microvirga lenta]|uniref:response regulator n=1 Tax=Microvirga lenta TaxID=2881337 RepID=UPI001CFF5C45|nr:response regulator [Microvirga lenta]MCB5177576.1 response regulator [Microvirga lenta]
MSNDSRSTIILVVEDEALVRMLASDILTEDGGYRVIEAVNADEALTLLEARHDVRLVFTDVDMPGTMNGFALARAIDLRFPSIEVIVTSGRKMPGVGELPEGIPFLPKPYASSALIQAVRKALRETGELMAAEHSDAPPAKPTSPVLPNGLKINQPHTGVGTTGGLAQPLPEPSE